MGNNFVLSWFTAIKNRHSRFTKNPLSDPLYSFVLCDRPSEGSSEKNCCWWLKDAIISVLFFKSCIWLSLAHFSQVDFKIQYDLLTSICKKMYYNIARALVLSKSYWAIMNKIFVYTRPCSIKWHVQFHFSCKISVEFSASSFCLSFGNVKIILNNPNHTSNL